MRAVEACGNRFVVSKELWARSVRPQFRQLPQPGAAEPRPSINEFGCLAGSAWAPLRVSAADGFAPRRGCPCGPSSGELRRRAPVQG